MNVFVSVICYKYKVLKDGTSPLMLRVSINGQRSMKSLGISLHPSDWDFRKNIPKSRCPDREAILALMNQELERVNREVLRRKVEGKDIIPKDLLEERKEERKVMVTVDSFYHEVIAGLRSKGKIGNSNAYLNSYDTLVLFNDGKPLKFSFQNIDARFWNAFDEWMHLKGYKDTTIHFHLRTLRALCKKALKEGHCPNDYSPLPPFPLSRYDLKTRKRALNKEDILKVMHCDCSSNRYMQLSKDIFLFSYLSGGMSYTDIVHLEKGNIQGNVILYTRQKTHREIRVVLPKEAMDILSRYSSESHYLFPVLNEARHTTPLKQYNRVRKTCAMVNRYLKEIGVKAGVEGELSTYVARHSFATVLKKSGVNIGIISEMLGHADISTTQIYLDSFDDEQLQDAMDNLL